MEQKKDVLRETDAAAVALAHELMRSARFGAIAVIDPESGAPLASRVGVATDADGAPIILVSLLAAHTRALIADPRCSLLLGEPGKGDPLAHPRITLICEAARLEPGSRAHETARRRYLNRNPKAKLYVGLGDFSFFRLEPQRASLNGGFGKAYALTAADLLLADPVVGSLEEAEQRAVDHMNEDHADAIDLYARHFGGRTAGGWIMTGLDAEGVDLVRGDEVCRVSYPASLTDASAMRTALVDMVKIAREALG